MSLCDGVCRFDGCLLATKLSEFISVAPRPVLSLCVRSLPLIMPFNVAHALALYPLDSDPNTASNNPLYLVGSENNPYDGVNIRYLDQLHLTSLGLYPVLARRHVSLGQPHDSAYTSSRAVKSKDNSSSSPVQGLVNEGSENEEEDVSAREVAVNLYLSYLSELMAKQPSCQRDPALVSAPL